MNFSENGMASLARLGPQRLSKRANCVVRPLLWLCSTRADVFHFCFDRNSRKF